MSEAAKVRLVRCPKCENLLPELTGYSVYQCGGCGAVLRAKNRTVDPDTFSKESDQEKVGGVQEKLSDKSDWQMMNLSDGLEHDVNSSGSSSRRAEKKEVLQGTTEKYRDTSALVADKWVVEDDFEKEINELNYSKIAEEFEELESQRWNVNGSQRSGRVLVRRAGERGEMHGFQSTQRVGVEGVRYSTLKNLEEGSSNYHLGSSYGYAEPLRCRNDSGVLDKVEYLEQDREELLRKLDELKDQLSRSCDLVDKPKEKVPVDRRMAHQSPYNDSENWYPHAPSRLDRASMQYSMPDKHVGRPPYSNHFDEPPPFVNRHEIPMHGVYPSMHTSNQVHGFGDPFRSQMLGRPPYQAPHPFAQHPAHPYFSGQYMGNEMVHMDPFGQYAHNVKFHVSSCSCFNCYNEQKHVPSPVPPNSLNDKMLPDGPNNSMLYNNENPGAFGPRCYNPPLSSHVPQAQTRWHSDLNSEVGSFVRQRTQRVVITTGGRRCRPVAGGAPFITCQNCFELLQLPKKILLTEKNQKKMRCGACSSTIIIAVANKELVVSIHAEAQKTPARVDNGHDVAAYESDPPGHCRQNGAGMNFSSNDYDDSGYDFHSMDRELASSSTGHAQSSNKSAEMRSLHSTSSYTSEDEDISENLIHRRKRPNSTELPMKARASSPLGGSPLQDHCDYVNKYHLANRSGKGSMSGHSEQEKVIPKKVPSRQDSMKDVSLATEIDISSNEYSNTGTSQESGEGSRGEDHLRMNKVGESFFAGFIKKNFKDLSRSNQTSEHENPKVTVNGHPIPDRLIKKAQKLAGPIQPGQYWYDFRAGFWGVMGGPCLGIIPPFIEEFNYPMPEDCAGGNTAVFVNGRELHRKDMDLLGSRGLPTERDRSYIIEISGRVLDEDSGQELDGLGKLAPTVEKMKHGFGMKAPKAAAA